ncbi:ribosomal L7Ae/L30e/S12e/Gadd45 family protein [Candidatus Woesearchaeota archaeon]|nr:ribosomal L7Ae/L30e/S12e/Gadd45 family protein [Candidatus Woesearchaeota archaeon]
MEPIAELRKQVQGGKLVMGTSAVTRLLKSDRLSRVFAASNCPEEVANEVRQLCSSTGTELVQLPVPNDELGVLCKKPFSISLVGVIR